ncbi:MAG: magnesium transporter CorA family protein, partial [Candidatus Dormibacteria bacterium]
MRWLASGKGVSAEPAAAELGRALGRSGGPAWLDVQDPDAADFELISSRLGIHPLTVEDMHHQGQRPKWEEYQGYVFVVLVTPIWSGGAVVAKEQHLCISRSWVLSVHWGEAPWLEELRRRLGADPTLCRGSSSFLTYLVTEAIVDAAFPVLDRLDEQVDGLSDRLVTLATQRDLAEITGMRHSVTDLRRTLGAQRDCFQRMVTQSLGTGAGEADLYFRDVYDHLVRQYETIDSLRDLLAGAMDTYLSTVSNRLNGTMKTLTVVASLFLPLTFLTGFFGMNFAYETGVVQLSGAAFAGA